MLANERARREMNSRRGCGDLPRDIALIALPYGRMQNKCCVVLRRDDSLAQTRLHV